MKNKKGFWPPLIAILATFALLGAGWFYFYLTNSNRPANTIISQVNKLYNLATREGMNVPINNPNQLQLELFWQPTEALKIGEENLLGAFRVLAKEKGTTRFLSLCPSFDRPPDNFFKALRVYFINEKGLCFSKLYSLDKLRITLADNLYTVTLNNFENFVLSSEPFQTVAAISGICYKKPISPDFLLTLKLLIQPKSSDAKTASGKVIANENRIAIPLYTH